MTGLSAYAGDQARQANFAGDNYAPIIFAGSATPAPSLHQLPAGIHDFSGRVTDISNIERMAVTSGGGPCIVNIFGAPGIGKSALTVHVAHRLSKHFDEIQLYAELGELDGQIPTSTQVLQRFVAALDPATSGIPIGSQEVPTRYRSLLSGRRCLILLDNAQNAEQIADLVPGTATSVVLVTSRASLAAVQGILPYHLGLMSPHESLALLSNVSQRSWLDGQPPEAANMLIDQCGRLPLALRIVGAILKKKLHWTLEKVASDLAGEQTRLTKLAEGPLNIRSCFEISYSNLGEKEAQAFRLLSLLPLALFKLRHAASFLQQLEDDAEKVVEALVDAQLLETEDGRYFRFHDLLRLYARERSQAADDDPDGSRAARFLQELTGEFMASYSRCVQENTWTGTWPGGLGWPSGWYSGERFKAAPDSLYLRTRLTPADDPGGAAVSWSDALTRFQRILVLGAGGTGKTVLADRICYEIAAAKDNDTWPYDVGFTVPLRLLGDHDQSLEVLVADAVRSRYNLDLPQETLALLLRDRCAAVIFDGLDELPTFSRNRVAREICAFCVTYPSARVIVTSRPGPISDAFKENFSLYEIAHLTDADITEYIGRWSEVAEAVPDSYARLLNAIQSSEVSREWLATPLLLTQLIATYDRAGIVPQQEIDLYDMTYQILFERRDALRGIRRISSLSPQTIGRLVSYLTYELKARAGIGGISETEFRFLLRAFGQVTEHDVRYLDESLASLDLPLRRTPVEATGGERRWSVTRDPFSEYLAARWVSDSATFSGLANRLLRMIKSGDFIAGSQFVARLAARTGSL